MQPDYPEGWDLYLRSLALVGDANRSLQIWTRRLSLIFLCVSKLFFVSVFLFGGLLCLVKLEWLFPIWNLTIQLKFRKCKMTTGTVERWGKCHWLCLRLFYFASVRFKSINISWTPTRASKIDSHHSLVRETHRGRRSNASWCPLD